MDIEIIGKAFHCDLLQRALDALGNTLGQEGYVVQSFLFPRKSKRFTVLRSPHIDKKSREQFELLTYRGILRCKVRSMEDAYEVLSLVKESFFVGVQLQLRMKKSAYWQRIPTSGY
jgi:small subunit ribosomal protein S10